MVRGGGHCTQKWRQTETLNYSSACFPFTDQDNSLYYHQKGDVTLFFSILSLKRGTFLSVQPFTDCGLWVYSILLIVQQGWQENHHCVPLRVSVCKAISITEVICSVSDAYWPGSGFVFVQVQWQHPGGACQWVEVLYPAREGLDASDHWHQHMLPWSESYLWRVSTPMTRS